jgi:hypothetical protein
MCGSWRKIKRIINRYISSTGNLILPVNRPSRWSDNLSKAKAAGNANTTESATGDRNSQRFEAVLRRTLEPAKRLLRGKQETVPSPPEQFPGLMRFYVKNISTLNSLHKKLKTNRTLRELKILKLRKSAKK